MRGRRLKGAASARAICAGIKVNAGADSACAARAVSRAVNVSGASFREGLLCRFCWLK